MTGNFKHNSEKFPQNVMEYNEQLLLARFKDVTNVTEWAYVPLSHSCNLVDYNNAAVKR